MAETQEQREERILNAEVQVEFVHFEGLERTKVDVLEQTYKLNGVSKGKTCQFGELLSNLHEANQAHHDLGVFTSAVAEVRPGSDERSVRIYVDCKEKKLFGAKAGMEHNGSEPFGVDILILFLSIWEYDESPDYPRRVFKLE
eukprot:TRINITY_DN5366_c0_g1_i6.p2 TRINITY_DN5366_c0_g1~~TRINITY_DN5366_c0_g1_i6.p2  ORF type:complete len:143 (-),score=34.85 TRINITY_DN5366_c0_g1_i6:994-1422(-)